jgi:hypothetical protein
MFFSLMFALYLVSRVLGDRILKAFLPGTIIESLSIIYVGLTNNGIAQGGWFTDTNYSLATDFILIGFLAYQGKYKWQLGTLVLIALFFTGNTAAVFLIAVFILALIIRRDWNWHKILITSWIMIGIISAWTAFGYTQTLWARGLDTITLLDKPNVHNSIINGAETDNPFWYRIYVIEAAMQDIQPLGHGVSITGNNALTVHAVPLIIIDQIGIIGALAWCITVIYLLTHSKQKYLWILFVAIGVFDHETWDNAAPWFWTLAGTSMILSIKNDYIFKKN